MKKAMLIAAILALIPSLASAEFYVTAYGGYAIVPSTKAEAQGVISFLGEADIDFKDTPVFGGKAGWFFNDWMGVELDLIYAKPKLAAQTITETSTIPSGNITLSIPETDQSLYGGGASFILRLHKSTEQVPLEPYIGAGLSILRLNIEATTVNFNVPGLLSGVASFASDSDIAFSPQAQAGIRWFILTQLALGMEYQFRYAKFDFKSLEETLILHSFAGTLSWFFR